MATAQQIQEKFIQPLEAVLGEPRWKGADPEAIYAALVEDLAQFSPLALEGAMRTLRSEHRMFPSIHACVQACWKAVGVIPMPSPMARKSEHDTAWEARIATIRMVRTNQAMAWEADRKSWLVALLDFVEREERLPTEREAFHLARAAEANNDKCHIPDNPNLSASLFAFRKAMLDRAHRDVFGTKSVKDAAE